MDAPFAELKAQREALGLSLEDIFQYTRINPAYLEALETGRFDVLPETYIRLFLRKYAQEIGLDPTEMLGRYDTLVHVPKAAPPEVSGRRSASGPFLSIAFALVLVVIVGTVAVLRQEASDQVVSDDPIASAPHQAPSAGLPAPQNDQGIPGDSAVAETQTGSRQATQDQDAVAPAFAEGSEGRLSKPDASAAEAQDPSVSADALLPPVVPERLQARTAVAPADTGQPALPASLGKAVASAYALAFPLSVQDSLLALEGRAVDTVRISVSADGEPPFSATLSPGSLRRWNAHNRLLIEVDRASAIDLSLQGMPLTPQGDAGRRHRFFISRSSIWIEEIDHLPPPSRSLPSDR